MEGVKADLTVAVVPVAVKAFAHVGSASVSVTRQPVPAGEIVLRATDLGDGPIEGAKAPVKLADVLPEGLEASGISGTVRGWYETKEGKTQNGPHGTVTCSLSPELSCEYGEDAVAFSFIEVKIPVIVTKTGAFSGSDGVTVAGGGAPAAARSQSVSVGEEPVPFGIEDESFEMTPEEEGGVADAQAGSHPLQFTTAFTFNNTGEGGAGQPAQPRNLKFLLPAGLVGNAQLMPRCPTVLFDKRVKEGDGCPSDTAVGFAVVTFSTNVGAGLNEQAEVPVFNLAPGAGEPARFGFWPAGDPVYLTTSVRTGGDYGVTVDVENINQLVAFSSNLLTIWGAPNSPVHNSDRGNACLTLEAGCAQTQELPQTPFLTMPDSCENEFQGVMEANAWTLPEYLPTVDSTFEEGLDGCNQVPFEPAVEVAPDVQSSSSASGLTVHLHVPQKISEDSEALGEGTIRDATVALPEGVTLNPADAGGLEACSEAQIGYLNKTGPKGELEFTEKLPEPLEPGKNFCPDSAKLGTVTVKTPLLAKPLEGSVYLAAPAPNGEAGQNPFNSLLAMYVVAYSEESGVLVKAPVRVEANPVTGRLTAYSEDIPQLPFEDLELHFFGGSKSPLSTPPRCGAYTTSASFEPWSGGDRRSRARRSTSRAARRVNACPGALPFEPSLTTGTTSNHAGGFSPFTMTMSREDGHQNLQAISLHMPAGPLRSARRCRTVRRSAGRRGDMRPEQPDRRNDRQRRCRVTNHSPSPAARCT